MNSLTALIIDDNENNILVLEQLLSIEGVATQRVSNPSQISPMLDEAAHLDLIFLDLGMPGMHGYDVFDAIKSRVHLQKTKVIAYTVNHTEIDNARNMGFDGFLGKPLNAEEFPDQLVRIVRGEHIFYLP